MSLPQDIDAQREHATRLVGELKQTFKQKREEMQAEATRLVGELKQTFKQKREEMQAEEDWERRQVLWDTLFDLEQSINAQIPLMLNNDQLRRHVQAFVRLGHEIVISTVRTDEGKGTSPLIDNLERLQEIDRYMMAYQVDYLWHVEYEDDDGDSYTLYLGAGEVVDEWYALWDETDDDHQTPRYSYILPPLKFARDFFLKHQDNPDLIQILGTNF